MGDPDHALRKMELVSWLIIASLNLLGLDSALSQFVAPHPLRNHEAGFSSP